MMTIRPFAIFSAFISALMLISFQNCSVYTSEGRKLLDEQGANAGLSTSSNTNSGSTSSTQEQQTQETSSDGNITTGKFVYENFTLSGQTCAGCHDEDASGFGDTCGTLDCVSLIGKSAASIEAFVRGAGASGGMPVYSTSTISDSQLQDLIAYIQSL